MDINTLRIAATLVSFVTFVGIIAWALDRRKSQQFQDAAALPLNDD
ncbi:MAG: cbb3-type cytochrome c oxidase subunit 3 [Alphaproteobacteria bacterium]|nr:cbb3-type cytochrome c oxidase subunit 3 [Alphaproteobacteria bacterium]